MKARSNSLKKRGVSTTAIHAGEHPDPTTGALAPPIYQTTTFVFESAEAGAATFAGERPGYVYTRMGNPTATAFEEKIAALEGAEAALATASGMAAIASLVLTLVQYGDHLLATDSLYGATYDLFARRLPEFGIEVSFVDGTDPSAVRRGLRKGTRLVFLETPGNPTLKLADIGSIAEIAHEHGALVAVDNTFATPINQLPLALGADVVVHSATKYLGGHGDVIAGAIVGSADLIRRVRSETLNLFGGVISPFNAWLIVRGMQTLPLRMACHGENAMVVARFLEQRPEVAWVRYPGLPSHPQHDLAHRQMTGFGGMLAFELRGGLTAGRALMNNVRLCSLAVSLGDVRTLISHPASTTHAKVPREQRLASGITDGLVRLSVGLEDADDICTDLTQALAAAGQRRRPAPSSARPSAATGRA